MRENKCTVYYTLRMLLDTEEFCSLFDATLAQFEVCGETYAFAQYFRNSTTSEKSSGLHIRLYGREGEQKS